MQNKVLFVSNTANFSKFNRPFMRWFSTQGWQVDYVSEGEENVLDCDNQYAIPIARSPFYFKNIKAYIELKKIVAYNKYNIIHCHTPMGGVLARIAARNSGAKVIYTAHGFHFYRGAPIINWLIYYPIEKYLTKYTDCLITINQEDFNLAKRKFAGVPVYYIDGVGVDLSRFYPRTTDEKEKLRRELNYMQDDFIICDIAEINKNKNQIMLVKMLPLLRKIIPHIKVAFIGYDNYPKVRKLVDALNLNNIVKFWGYRNDIEKFASISNIAFSASLREGLPVNIIEAMACKTPIVCRKNRGHNALLIDRVSGLLFLTKQEMIRCILHVYNSKEFSQTLGDNAYRYSKKYDSNLILKSMAMIYPLPSRVRYKKDVLCTAILSKQPT